MARKKKMDPLDIAAQQREREQVAGLFAVGDDAQGYDHAARFNRAEQPRNPFGLFPYRHQIRPNYVCLWLSAPVVYGLAIGIN